MKNEDEDLDAVVESRRIANKAVQNAASHGDSLAGALIALEYFGSPFYLGLDSNPDSEDMDVFP